MRCGWAVGKRWSISLVTMPPTTSFSVQVLGLDHKIGSFEVRHGLRDSDECTVHFKLLLLLRARVNVMGEG